MVEPVKVCHGVKGIGQSSYNAFRQELLAPDPFSGPSEQLSGLPCACPKLDCLLEGF